jgi:hypothetical protein
MSERLGTPSWLARAAAVGLCFLSLGFVVLLAVPIVRGGQVALITKPLLMQVALSLPYLILTFTLGTVVGAGLGWWNRYWSLWGRIHQTLLGLLGVGFVWQLAEVGFLTL